MKDNLNTELEQILDKIVGEADPFHHYINTTRVVLETNLKSALNELLEQKTQQARIQLLADIEFTNLCWQDKENCEVWRAHKISLIKGGE